MKAHTMSLVSSLVLIIMSGWGYISSNYEAVTALIPLFFGVALLLCYSGIKKENKIIAHVAVLLTLIVLIALFKPLKGAIDKDNSMAIIRISVMIIGSAMSMTAFIRSFIAARKNKQQ